MLDLSSFALHVLRCVDAETCILCSPNVDKANIGSLWYKTGQEMPFFLFNDNISVIIYKNMTRKLHKNLHLAYKRCLNSLETILH